MAGGSTAGGQAPQAQTQSPQAQQQQAQQPGGFARFAEVALPLAAGVASAYSPYAARGVGVGLEALRAFHGLQEGRRQRQEEQDIQEQQRQRLEAAVRVGEGPSEIRTPEAEKFGLDLLSIRPPRVGDLGMGLPGRDVEGEQPEYGLDLEGRTPSAPTVSELIAARGEMAVDPALAEALQGIAASNPELALQLLTRQIMGTSEAGQRTAALQARQTGAMELAREQLTGRLGLAEREAELRAQQAQADAAARQELEQLRASLRPEQRQQLTRLGTGDVLVDPTTGQVIASGIGRGAVDPDAANREQLAQYEKSYTQLSTKDPTTLSKEVAGATLTEINRIRGELGLPPFESRTRVEQPPQGLTPQQEVEWILGQTGY